jgi:hypothetical protein
MGPLGRHTRRHNRLTISSPEYSKDQLLDLVPLCHARPVPARAIVDYIMKRPSVASAPPTSFQPCNFPAMVARGVGSRSSPIIIDDDDDNSQIPSRTKVNPNSSTLPAKTPPQESIVADTPQARDPIPPRPQHPDQSRNGIGYSMLVRMGYKPGHGLGVNLEGIRSLTTFLLGG